MKHFILVNILIVGHNWSIIVKIFKVILVVRNQVMRNIFKDFLLVKARMTFKRFNIN